MDRETLKLKTPDGVDFEVKSYITGREKQEIERVFYNEMELAGEIGGSVKLNKMFDLTKQNNIAIAQIVVSVNGNSENVLESVLDLRSADYDFILSKVNEISSGIERDKKKE
jgi:hypothetical protein